MTKSEAGRLGGKKTAQLYDMSERAKLGAAAFHRKYHLVKYGTSDWVIVDRATGKPTGKTISGAVIFMEKKNE